MDKDENSKSQDKNKQLTLLVNNVTNLISMFLYNEHGCVK